MSNWPTVLDEVCGGHGVFRDTSSFHSHALNVLGQLACNSCSRMTTKAFNVHNFFLIITLIMCT